MNKPLGVLLAAAVLSLSACGAGDDARPSSARLSSEPSAAAAADGSSGAAELTRDNFVERLAEAQREAGSAHLSMTVDAAGAQAAMEGDVRIDDDLAKSASQLTMDLGATSVDVRLVDQVMYLKMGEMTGGKYVRMDLSDPNSPLAKQYGSMTDQADPQTQLETFRRALVSFENEGDGGTVDGVATTKLALTVDTRKALADQAAQPGAQLPKRLTYVLHVGREDDLLRRMTVDMAQAPTTIDWSRWGEKVTIEAPPASEISDRAAPGAAGVRG